MAVPGGRSRWYDEVHRQRRREAAHRRGGHEETGELRSVTAVH